MTPRVAHAQSPRALSGLALALVSAASFGLSGALARGLLAEGWTPGAVVLARIAIGAAVVAPFGLVAMRGRWAVLRAHWRTVVVVRAVRRRGPPVLLLLRDRPHGSRARPADRVHRSGRRGGVAVVALRRAARATDARRCRRGRARAVAGARPALRSRAEPARRAVGPRCDGRLRDVLRDVRRRGQRPPAAGPGHRRLGGRRPGAGRRWGWWGCSRWRRPPRSVELAGATVSWWVPIVLLGVVTAAVVLRHRHRGHPPTGVAAGVVRRAGSSWSSACCGPGSCWTSCRGRCSCSGGVLILAGVVAVKLGSGLPRVLAPDEHLADDQQDRCRCRDRQQGSDDAEQTRHPRGPRSP